MRILADQSTGTGLAIWAIVLIVIAVILVILFAFIIHWWIKTYNTFRKYQQIIKESLSDIDVALEKRFDLLTKMFDITKGYAKHEHDTLADVVGLRSGIPAGATAKDLSDINTKLDQASNSINIIFEKYPDLKANTLFLEL
jgi:LemA protein